MKIGTEGTNKTIMHLGVYFSSGSCMWKEKNSKKYRKKEKVPQKQFCKVTLLAPTQTLTTMTTYKTQWINSGLISLVMVCVWMDGIIKQANGFSFSIFLVVQSFFVFSQGFWLDWRTLICTNVWFRPFIFKLIKYGDGIYICLQLFKIWVKDMLTKLYRSKPCLAVSTHLVQICNAK